MQIKDLPSSDSFDSTDVIAKDTSEGATKKVTGSILASAIKSIASLLGVSDLVNGLTSTDATKALAAPQGKALNEAIGDKLDTANVYNGLDQTASGYALDARQGKALNDAKANASDIAIIIDGNQTTHTGGVAVGEFVLVRNSTISGITDGLYTAAQAIPANTAIDSTYMAAVEGGGLNAVVNQSKAITTSGVTPTSGIDTYSMFVDRGARLVFLSFQGKGNVGISNGGKMFDISNDYAPVATDNTQAGVCFMTSGATDGKAVKFNIRILSNRIEVLYPVNQTMYAHTGVAIWRY